jgi:hypothetical protein
MEGDRPPNNLAAQYPDKPARNTSVGNNRRMERIMDNAVFVKKIQELDPDGSVVSIDLTNDTIAYSKGDK